MTTSFYLGSYTENGAGSGAGVQRIAWDSAQEPPQLNVQAVSTGIRNPSWVHAGPAAVFAVEELDDGAVVALDPQTLRLLKRASSGGQSPCHLAVVGEQLVVANYSDGVVSGLPLDPNSWDTAPVWSVRGPWDADEAQEAGKNPERQEQPHAHFILPLTQNRPDTFPEGDHFLVSDLGRDRVDHYEIVDQSAHLRDSIRLPHGTGPRHLLLRGNDLWVVGELDAQLHRLSYRDQDWVLDPEPVPLGPDKGTAAQARAAGTTVPAPSEITQVPQSPADASIDGACANGAPALVVAVRGTDTLAVVPLAQARMAGGPEKPLTAHSVLCGGSWPRHLAFLDAAHALVANEQGHLLSLFRFGAEGIPAHIHDFEAFSPSCVVPVT